MKTIKAIILIIAAMVLPVSAIAAEVQRESAPCNTSEEAIIVAENLIGSIFIEVQNRLGYADARAKSNAILFEAWLNGQTGGYSYGELADVANNAIRQYRDMYLKPEFYTENIERVKAIISSVIDEYVAERIDYQTAAKNVHIRIYQSVNPSFNPEVEFSKDTCYRDIPAVDSGLFAIARKLILESK